MGGNIIWVRTLDLNQPFTQIAGQLEKIAEDYFGENVMEQNADSIIRRYNRCSILSYKSDVC